MGKRLDQLEEGVAIMRSLWRDDVTNFSGEHYSCQGAVGTPKPLKGDIKLGIGGFGPERTPRLAARYPDGFSLPYMSPEHVADRLQRLRAACEDLGREPDALDSSVNVGFFMGADTARDVPPGGALVGSPQRVMDRIGEYERTGIRGLNIGIRAPIDWDALEEFIEVVLPTFHASPSGAAAALP